MKLKRYSIIIALAITMIIYVWITFFYKININTSAMKSTELANYFSNTYQIARQRFLDASIKKQARLDKLKLDVAGPSGEDLTVDIAWFGSSAPENVLIHVSGIHGVEGFSGSAIQIKMIED